MSRFQSTPPARGATLFRFHFCFSYDKFQSTPPARGATPKYRIIPTNTPISIHAPREGGDTMIKYTAYILHHFNPRPPRGGRLHLWITSLRMPLFQSTPPARGATNNKVQIMPNLRFQSTPPARGATKSMLPSWERQYHFNPRPPRGGRHDLNLDWLLKTVKISIHAPREGGDSKDAQFYLRIFDKQVELLRFLGKIRGGCLRNPEKDRRFLGKSLANLPEISGHLDFAGGGKAHPGYPCAVPLPRRAACVRGSGDPPADRCSSYRNAPLFSHIASLDSKSADCLSQNP